MTVKSEKITNIGKDVESGESATTPQNPKGCCSGLAFLKFLTWLYCTLIAVFGGFWLAQLPSLVGPYACFVMNLSLWGFIPACLCFFGLGGARSLIAPDRKDKLWSIRMFIYFFDWIVILTFVLLITDLIVVIIAYCAGPDGTVFNFLGLSQMWLARTGVFAVAGIGCLMLGKAHKEAFKEAIAR